jgi:inhibitor of cysteine peptidase
MKTAHYNKLYAVTVLVFLLLFVFGSCAQLQPHQPKEVSVNFSEIEQTVGLEVGDTLEVVLPANPSTGYSWEVGFYNKSVIMPKGEPEFAGSSTNLGAEESQMLHFEVIGKGETDVVLVYRRSFEDPGADQKTFKVTVVVE